MSSPDISDAAVALVDALVPRLRAAGLADHALAASTLTPGPGRAAGAAGSVPLPVLRHLPTALALAAPADLAAAFGAVAPRLAWTRTASYVADPPGPGFLEGYAHTTLAGPADGDPAHGAALGALLLGPGVDYPRHHHPADEVYVPLTTAWWAHDVDDALAPVLPGQVIHHRSWQPHAMRTGDGPLLALYLWTGDVGTPSEFA